MGDENVREKVEVTSARAQLNVTFTTPPGTWVRVGTQGNDEFKLELDVEGATVEEARERLARLRAAFTEALNT